MSEVEETMASEGITHQALLVPEILESILLQLSLKDLLLNAQLVSHQWNSAIATSTHLQQALFFHASPADEFAEAVFNPLLQKFFPPWFDEKPRYRYSRGSAFTNLAWNKSDARRAAFMREEASWRRMLPIQPPPKVLEVLKRSSYRRGSDNYKGEVEFPKGVRMGTLYDFIYTTLARPISSFAIEWHRPLMNGSESDLEAANAVEKKIDFVTMAVSWTAQCRRGMPPDVGKEFRSKAYEVLEIEFSEIVPTPKH